MRIKKSTVFLTMFVLLLAFTGCQNESSSTDENKQTKSTASDKVIYNQKDLQNPQKLEISEDGTVEMEIKSMTEPDNILPENKSIFLSITSKKDTDVSLQYTYDTYGKEGALFCCELKEKNGVKTTLEPLSSFHHTFLFEPKVISSGVSGKFFSDHSVISSGCTSAKLLFIAKPQPPCA